MTTEIKLEVAHVKSKHKQDKDGGNKLAIFDRNEAYDGGELYIADEKVHEVPLTNEVLKKINDGELVRVDTPADMSHLPKAQEGDGNPEVEAVTLEEDDTVDTLALRYSKPSLVAYAKENNIGHAANATRKQIAAQILDLGEKE